MATKIAFGDYQFGTKKEATEEARRRINKYAPGSKLSSDDEHFFISLFELHSERNEKVGIGIDHIKVEIDFRKNRCLYIHRTDGSNIDCSWVHCIKPATHQAVVSMAFRRAVKDIIINFKNEQLPKVSICPILGIKLSYENSHVSYKQPEFKELLNNFLEQVEVTFDLIRLDNPKPSDSDQRGILANKELADKWCVYHQKNANLQLISAEANLRRLKSQ